MLMKYKCIEIRFEPNSYYSWKIRSHFLARDSYAGGQSGCFARVIVGNAFWENNCSKVMVSAYSKPLNLWVIAMVFGLVIDFESGKCQASLNVGMLTIWFPYIKRCMSDRHSWPNLNQQAMQLSTLSDHQKDLEMWVMNYMFSRVTSS